MISGSDAPPDIVYLTASGTTIADGNDTPTYPTARDPFNPTPRERTSDDICKPGKVVAGFCTEAEKIVSVDVVEEVDPVLIDTGTIQVVPEPGYGPILLLLLAILSLYRVAVTRAAPRQR
jgi:hypothetical protein